MSGVHEYRGVSYLVCFISRTAIPFKLDSLLHECLPRPNTIKFESHRTINAVGVGRGNDGIEEGHVVTCGKKHYGLCRDGGSPSQKWNAVRPVPIPCKLSPANLLKGFGGSCSFVAFINNEIASA